MSPRRHLNSLFYFTIEDESMLAEAFTEFDDDIFAVTYKVGVSEDVFVMTAETREAMDRFDVPYNLLAEEDPSRISIYHTPLSKEELSDYEDALKALTLAYRGIAAACVGINGETDLGFDLTKTNDQRIWNLHGKLTFRSRKWNTWIDGTSYLISPDSIATSTRNTLVYAAQRFIAKSAWSVLGGVAAEQNDELSLDHRYTATAAAGNFFIQTNRIIFQGIAGFASTDELYTGETDATQNIETVFGLTFELFQFADPEVDLSIDGLMYVSVSDWGRIRPELNASLSWEVINDLDIGFRGYIQSDSRPAEGARNIDYALTTTFGYSWD